MDEISKTNPDIVTLREYIESRLEAVTATMNASDKALEVRLAAMNELRDQINAERGQYVTRADVEKDHRAMLQDIRELRESRAALAGKASMASVFWTGMLSLLSVVLASLALLSNFMK